MPGNTLPSHSHTRHDDSTGEPPTTPSTSELDTPAIPNYENAASLHPDELWRYPDNGGQTQAPAYIEVQSKIRSKLVEEFRSGQLYSSTDAFIESLRSLHYMAAETYAQTGGRTDQLQPSHYGRLDDRAGPRLNRRIWDAISVVDIAQRYGDPYGVPNRFKSGNPPNTESVHTVHLLGISAPNLPYDTVRYDAQGRVREVGREEDPQGGYEYMYPNAQNVHEYLNQMQQIGNVIESAIKSGSQDTNMMLGLIARQYQYGACARPFRQINNSLLMQLVNMQVKLLGLPGMTHGLMDAAAQRMQPEAFAHYFIARAYGQES